MLRHLFEASTFLYILVQRGRLLPRMTITAPLVVVGSINADIYVEVERLPKEDETVVARSGHTFAGGKGANQASCAARLLYPTYFVGQVLK